MKSNRQSGNWSKSAPPLMVRLSPSVRAEVEAAAREERRFSAVIDRLVTDWAVARDLARIGNPK